MLANNDLLSPELIILVASTKQEFMLVPMCKAHGFLPEAGWIFTGMRSVEKYSVRPTVLDAASCHRVLGLEERLGQ